MTDQSLEYKVRTRPATTNHPLRRSKIGPLLSAKKLFEHFVQPQLTRPLLSRPARGKFFLDHRASDNIHKCRDQDAGSRREERVVALKFGIIKSRAKRVGTPLVLSLTRNRWPRTVPCGHAAGRIHVRLRDTNCFKSPKLAEILIPTIQALPRGVRSTCCVKNHRGACNIRRCGPVVDLTATTLVGNGGDLSTCGWSRQRRRKPLWVCTPVLLLLAWVIRTPAPSQLFLIEIPPIGVVNAETAPRTGAHHALLPKLVLQESFQLWPVSLPAYQPAARLQLELVSFASGC